MKYMLCTVIAVIATGTLHALGGTSNTWGKILYTHYSTSKIYAAPVSAAAIQATLAANETVKADFKRGDSIKGEWYAVFRPSEEVRSITNAIGYMDVQDLFPAPLPPGPIAGGVGDSPSVATTIESMRPIPPPSKSTSYTSSPVYQQQPQPVSAPNPWLTPAPSVQSKEPELSYSEGKSFQVGYMTYQVSRSWWSDKLSDNEYLDQKPNAMYLFVELTVRNDDKKERIVPPFKLNDEKDRENGASAGAWVMKEWIGGWDALNPGVSKKGFIVFDVQKDHKYKLKVSGGFWSAADAFVTLKPR